MDRQVDDAGVDDETYLEASGLDSDAVAAAGERAEQGQTSGSSRKETVRAALRELDNPTEDEIVAHAAEQGVSADYTRKALQKLVQAGEAAESRGVYRLV